MSADSEVNADVREDVTEAYAVVMYDEVQRWEYPGFPQYFIEAKHPGLGEDRIQAAMAPGASVHVKGKNEYESDISMAKSTEAGFVQKCVEQVTDYNFPTADKDDKGKVVRTDAKFRPSNRGGGDTKANRYFYTGLLRHPLRLHIEEFLDFWAARDADTQEDFEALGEGPGR